MPQRGWLTTALTIAPLAGCVGDASYDPGYAGSAWEDAFIADGWIYYDEDDEDFLAGLSDEQKEALKRKWDELSPEEKQRIRDRWNSLDDSQRVQMREAWSGLNAEQRQEVLSTMESRLRGSQYPSFERGRTGTSPYSGGSLDRGAFGGRGSVGGGSAGGLGGGALGGGSLGGRGGGGFGGGRR
jgi:hypothetical protein